MHRLKGLRAAAALCLLGAAPATDSGFKTIDVAVRELGDPIVHSDFERCAPAGLIKARDEKGEERWLAEDAKADRARGHWVLRHPGWAPALINVVGAPADLTYDPKLEGVYDIYLGLRAVPRMSLGVLLSGEEDFDVLTAPAATETRHYNYEFHWREAVDLTGRQIVIRSVGRPVYLQHIRFVPRVSKTRKLRVATDHVTVCKTAGRHHAFPGVARLPDGSLGAVFRDGVAHVCPFGRILFVRSTDNGRTWGEPTVVSETPSDERDPAILTLPDGRVAVSFNTWNSWMASGVLKARYAAQTARIEKDGLKAHTGLKIVFSTDSGRTWGEVVKIPVFSPHGPTVGPDGHLYYAGTRSFGGRMVVTVWRSEDGGVTWVEHGDVGASMADRNDAGAEVFREPHLTILPDGTWIVGIRVALDGYVRLAFSKDGRRWSRPRKTNVRGYPQHLLPLADGRLLMTYGYRYPGYGIRACVSADGGKTWDLANEIVLRHEGASKDLGYPVSLEMGGGRVLTVYYYVGDDKLCYIEGAFYKP